MSKQEIKVLSDVEHVLQRPGMYIGSTKRNTQEFWIPVNNEMIKKNIEYIPGQFKLFCEILDNALDEHIRGFGNKICIKIDTKNNTYSIKDEGRGIPIDLHKDLKVPTPQVVFTQLRSGSNFDDTNRETVGMNGVGASLATVFSEYLKVDIVKNGKRYQQCYKNNMSVIENPVITDSTHKNGTLVEFKLDSKYFDMSIPEELILKRCLELSFMFPKLTILIQTENGEKIKYSSDNFEDFVKMFSQEYKIIDENKLGLRLALCINEKTESFEQYSNVNGADTFRGGTHIDYFREMFTSSLKDKIKKEYKLEVTPQDINRHIILVCFLNWNAPDFEGQTKEKFVNDKKSLDEKFSSFFTSKRITFLLNDIANIKQKIVDYVTLKNEKKTLADLKKTQKNIKRQKIPKLIDATGKDREKCHLYIMEGDSASFTLASVRDPKTIGGIPLRGKVLNVFEMSPKDIVENKEIQSLMGALGLVIGESPLTISNGKLIKNKMNYGKIIIATDQDMDGYCIRCLLINFFYKFWPELFDYNIVCILESPLYRVRNKKDVHYFYNKREYEQFMESKSNNKYEVSYFKGLGGCDKNVWDYMVNKHPNLINVKPDENSKNMLQLVFGEDSDKRKEWLS